jgi:hypothetical protein
MKDFSYTKSLNFVVPANTQTEADIIAEEVVKNLNVVFKYMFENKDSGFKEILKGIL